jgi:GT2 family glycosyltransferase
VNRIGVVAIGRNEGARLRRCLESARRYADAVVYVDSASSDDSVHVAGTIGAEVVALDMSLPFSAARARNAGFERLVELAPDVQYVQFVDGDCEIANGWADQAVYLLDAQPELAVVAGRRRERFPERTIYNRLCDMEWDTPLGESRACGGDAMMRVEAFRAVGGYDPSVIAGEEPEMCVRLRAAGWKILRADADMTWHDADMYRFRQWWRRTVRAGHAYAEGAWMHGAAPERHWVRESLSIWFWAAVVPLVALTLAWPTGGWSLLILAAYLVLWLRVVSYGRRRGWGTPSSIIYALFVVLGKFPQLLGQLKFFLLRALGRKSRLIEYKTAATQPVSAPAELSRGAQ